MAKYFKADIGVFTGYNEIIESKSLKQLYKIVISEARAAGCNLVDYEHVRIQDNNDRPICLIANYHGQIIVAGSRNVVTVREDRHDA